MTIIETKQITRGFDLPDGQVFYALKKIDLLIPEGKLTILKGRSGSGKTTLMNILGALDSPSEGSLIFMNEDITHYSEDKRCHLRRTQIGFVFQSVALIPNMTAYENVEFALRLSEYKGDKKKRVQECLHMVGLSARMNHMPNEMSGGEQQRVAIARAMVHCPKVIFADEPTAELDTNTGLKVVKILKELTEKENVTIVMTTHDTGLMQLGDCVYELESGEMISHGQC